MTWRKRKHERVQVAVPEDVEVEIVKRPAPPTSTATDDIDAVQAMERLRKVRVILAALQLEGETRGMN